MSVGFPKEKVKDMTSMNKMDQLLGDSTLHDEQLFHLLELPSDIVLYICTFLHGSDVLTLSQVCKNLHQLCNEPSLWATMIQEQFGQVCADFKGHEILCGC